jgi:hypothetical protein
MKVVYVAGPYRAASEWEVVQNIRKAEAVALELWRMGVAVICPHKNTALFGGAADDSVWLDGDLELLRRSDAVVCVHGWAHSRGSRNEVSLAHSLNIPVFEDSERFRDWLYEQTVTV